MKTKLLLAVVVLTTHFFYAQNLVAYYPFNGNANDESGNGNNGTVNGATLTTDRFGNANSAYYFDGSSNYISITDNPNINIQTGESFTISYWCKYDAQNNATYLISKYKGSFGEPSFALGTGSGDLAYSWFEFTPSNGIENRGAIHLYDTNWHNITTVFTSGESVSIYVDGVLDISHPITHTGSIINTRNLTIGCGSNLAQFYKGAIDDIKIYKKALTEQEIKNEVNGLIAYYPFNGNANDESGNNNNGTVYGAILTTDKDGNNNSAYYFDGIDNYIDLGDWTNGGAMTFTFWARWDAFNNYSRIIDLGNGSSSNNIIISNYQTNNGLFFSIYTSGETRLINTNTITQNQWDFYGATVDENGIMTLYKNGQQIAQKTDGVTPTTILRTQQFIGKSNFTADGYFKGFIDEVKIYNKVLTATEIQNEANGLIAYYPFNGNANDESGNNLNGTVSGATLTTDRFGNPDSAYSFDGNDIITVAHNDILNCSDELSISVWVKPNSLQDAMILGKSNYTSTTNYLLRTKSTGYIAFEYKDFANSNSLPLTANVWNHIAVISKSDNSKQVYINGVLATHTSDTSPFGLVTNALTIGARSGAEFFNGSIDDLRIYKSALTESNVLNLYNNNSLDVADNQLKHPNTFYVFNNILYFGTDQNLSEIKNISIYNILAQKVYKSTKIQNELTLDFLDQGIYILKIELNNGKVDTKKFLIQ